MPELPDLSVYLDHLNRLTRGDTLEAIRLASPFVLRTVNPAIETLQGRPVQGWHRIAKQLVLALNGEYFLVIHLMRSGRLKWQPRSHSLQPNPRRSGLAALDFPRGSLLYTEASKKKRASLRLVQGRADLAQLDPGGLDALGCDLADFRARLCANNHTLKRALTDQRVIAGIGNAYSDEIFLRAGLSPFKRAGQLKSEEIERLHRSTQRVLSEWIERLGTEAGETFPRNVTAFHKAMAVHGKYRSPCPVCETPVQRIVYAENEANYCPTCQTGGRILADRSLSRLLKDTWPKRVEDLENF